MNNLRLPGYAPQLKGIIIMPFLDRFHSNFTEVHHVGNENLSKISGKLERVP